MALMRCPFGCAGSQDIRTNDPFLQCRCGARMEQVFLPDHFADKTPYTPDLRYRRADAMTAHVMRVLHPHLDQQSDPRPVATALMELFYAEGVEIITDATRASAGLPPRGAKGLTDQELAMLDMRRVQTMLAPISPVIIPKGDGQ